VLPRRIISLLIASSVPDLYILSDKFLSTCNISSHFSCSNESLRLSTQYDPKRRQSKELDLLEAFLSSLVATRHSPMNKSMLTRLISLTSSKQTEIRNRASLQRRVPNGRSNIVTVKIAINAYSEFRLCSDH
jgi:hypothetical protein